MCEICQSSQDHRGWIERRRGLQAPPPPVGRFASPGGDSLMGRMSGEEEEGLEQSEVETQCEKDLLMTVRKDFA